MFLLHVLIFIPMHYYLFFAIHFLIQPVSPDFEPAPCISQPMTIQLQASLLDEAFHSRVIRGDNRLEWCQENRIINIYTRSVEKFSFRVHLEFDPSREYWIGKGTCSSGSQVDIELALSDDRIDWIRIFYPEYRFLYIFAQDEEKLEPFISRQRGEGVWTLNEK
jgi:hypothetical protein